MRRRRRRARSRRPTATIERHDRRRGTAGTTPRRALVHAGNATGAVARSASGPATPIRGRDPRRVVRSRPHACSPCDGQPRVVTAGGARRRRSALGSPSIVVLAAAPAFAHAVLLSTSPAAELESCAISPKQLELTFDENVEISFGSIQLFNQKGDRGRHRRAAPLGDDRPTRSKRACPTSPTARTCVTWRVISADSHPVHGAFTFTVGQLVGERRSASRPSSKPQGGGNKTVGVLFAIARARRVRGHRAADRRGRCSRPRSGRTGGAARAPTRSCGSVGSCCSSRRSPALLLQGPYAGALPLSEIFHTAVVRAVLQTRYGHIAEIRLAAAARGAAADPGGAQDVATALRGGGCSRCRSASAIAATPGLAGHAVDRNVRRSSRSRSTRCTSLAMSDLARRPGRARASIVLDRDPDAGAVGRRASRRSRSTSVIVIVATGVFAAWRQVGWSRRRVPRHDLRPHPAREDRRSSSCLLALAAWSRRIVRARRPATLSAAVATEDAPRPTTATVPPIPTCATCAGRSAASWCSASRSS